MHSTLQVFKWRSKRSAGTWWWSNVVASSLCWLSFHHSSLMVLKGSSFCWWLNCWRLARCDLLLKPVMHRGAVSFQAYIGFFWLRVGSSWRLPAASCQIAVAAQTISGHYHSQNGESPSKSEPQQTTKIQYLQNNYYYYSSKGLSWKQQRNQEKQEAYSNQEAKSRESEFLVIKLPRNCRTLAVIHGQR